MSIAERAGSLIYCRYIAHMNLEETTVTSTRVYDGKLLKVHHDIVRLPNGREGWREWVEHPRGVIVVPMLDSRKLTVLMLRHFRYATKRVMYELPAGLMDKPGEPPEAAAARELVEETGYVAKRLTALGQFYSQSGFCTDTAYYYLATDLGAGAATPEDDEHFEYVHLDLNEAIRIVMGEPIQDARTLLGLMLAQRKLAEMSP